MVRWSVLRLGAVFIAATVGLTALSRWIGVVWDGQDTGLFIGQGRLLVRGAMQGVFPSGVRIGFLPNPNLILHPIVHQELGFTAISIPIWMMASALFVFWLIIRRWWKSAPVSNACINCGYSQIGLPTTRCPECGTDQNGRVNA